MYNTIDMRAYACPVYAEMDWQDSYATDCPNTEGAAEQGACAKSSFQQNDDAFHGAGDWTITCSYQAQNRVVKWAFLGHYSVIKPL